MVPSSLRQPVKLAKENEESSSLPSFTAWCLFSPRQLVKLAKENEESSSMPSFTAWCLFSPRQLVKLAKENRRVVVTARRSRHGASGRRGSRLSSRRRNEESSSLPSFTAWCLWSPRQLVKLAKETDESSVVVVLRHGAPPLGGQLSLTSTLS